MPLVIQNRDRSAGRCTATAWIAGGALAAVIALLLLPVAHPVEIRWGGRSLRVQAGRDFDEVPEGWSHSEAMTQMGGEYDAYRFSWRRWTYAVTLGRPL